MSLTNIEMLILAAVAIVIVLFIVNAMNDIRHDRKIADLYQEFAYLKEEHNRIVQKIDKPVYSTKSYEVKDEDY